VIQKGPNSVSGAIQKAISIGRGFNRTSHIVYLTLTTPMQMIPLKRYKHESFQTAEILHLKTWPTGQYIGITIFTLITSIAISQRKSHTQLNSSK